MKIANKPALIEALESDPPPCKKRGYTCHNYKACKEKEIACQSFCGYATGSGGQRGKPLDKRFPNEHFFKAAMLSGGDTSQEKAEFYMHLAKAKKRLKLAVSAERLTEY